MAQRLDDTRIARNDGLLHRCGNKKVAHKYRYMIIPHGVDRRTATTYRRTVNNIIVYKRSIVQQFDRCRSTQHLVRHRPEKPSTQHHYNGTDKFALAFQIISNHVIHQWIRRGQLVCYERVEPVNVGSYFLSYFFEDVHIAPQIYEFFAALQTFSAQTFGPSTHIAPSWRPSSTFTGSPLLHITTSIHYSFAPYHYPRQCRTHPTLSSV